MSWNWDLVNSGLEARGDGDLRDQLIRLGDWLKENEPNYAELRFLTREPFTIQGCDLQQFFSLLREQNKEVAGILVYADHEGVEVVATYGADHNEVKLGDNLDWFVQLCGNRLMWNEAINKIAPYNLRLGEFIDFRFGQRMQVVYEEKPWVHKFMEQGGWL